MNTQNSIASSISQVSVDTKSNFQLRQVTVKGQSNEALFKLIEKAVKESPVQVIVTPRIDAGNYPYYWIGVRFDRQELNFKLLVNDQIVNFILAYLKGDEPLPTVTDFKPTSTVADSEEWLFKHQSSHSQSAISCKEELVMRDDVSYLTTKLNFMNGKVIYPSTKCEDVLSIILA